MTAVESREAQYRRIMPEDEGMSGLEADERRLYGEPWPAWSHTNAEQPPFTSHLAAARWADDHDEDLNRYDDGDDQ